jgi:hypothetical protein
MKIAYHLSMAFSAKVLKDSRSPNGHRLTTMELTYPRFVHSEFMTHRVFSRNAASSRAIPVSKMLSKVWREPVVPVWIGKNQSGMQAKEELTGLRRKLGIFFWLLAGRAACVFAWLLNKLNLHKQIVNRVIEPWAWITVIVTATEWSNFFALRTHPDAQPELQHIAVMAQDAYDASKPDCLRVNEYHLPLVEDFEQLYDDGYMIHDIVKICVGRCARVSYLTHDGKRNPDADIALCDRLQESGHMSPFEHVGRVPYESEAERFYGNFYGWIQHRKTLPNEADFSSRSPT